MRLPKVTIIKITSLQSRENADQNRSLSGKFCNGVNRWDKWANSIADRFRRSALQFFSLEMFFLKPLFLTRVLLQQWTLTSRLTSFSLPLFVKPVLTKIARQIANHSLKLVFTSSLSKKLKSGFKLIRHIPQTAEALNRIQIKEFRYDGSVEYNSRSTIFAKSERIKNGALLIEPFETQNSLIQSPRISERLQRKEIRNIKYYENTENSTTTTLNDTWQINSSAYIGMKGMNQRDDSRMEEREYQFSDNPPPMVFRRHAPPDIEGEKPTQTFPCTTGSHTYDPTQRPELSPPVNIDLITEEVIRQIDHKLLIWRERTGKV